MSSKNPDKKPDDPVTKSADDLRAEIEAEIRAEMKAEAAKAEEDKLKAAAKAEGEKKEKRERRTMVYCRNNVYLEGAGGKAVKVKKGFKVLMSDDETDHFEGAVTRDIPKRSKGEDPIVEFTRG